MREAPSAGSSATRGSRYRRQGRREGDAARGERRRHRRGLLDCRRASAGHRRAEGRQFPAGRRRAGRAGALHARPSAARSRAESGRSEPARDTAQAANAKVIAQRMEDLVERGVGTREQRDTARTTAAALDAVVGANRAAVENAKVQLQYATIRAPISGRTGALMVQRRQPRARERPDCRSSSSIRSARSTSRSAFLKRCFPTCAATWRSASSRSRQLPPNEEIAPATAASRSSTTRSIRRPARSESRPHSRIRIAGSGPGSSSTSA